MTLKKEMQSGVLNLGYLYEEMVASYVALSLVRDSKVKNFQLQINPSGYGKFDDIIIKIELLDSKEEYFAIQLKHRQVGRENISAKEFDRRGSGFDILRYREAFDKLEPEVQDSHKFILFTNAKFIDTENYRRYKVQAVQKPFKTLLFNSFNMKHALQDDDSKFYQNFFLLTEQKNYTEMKEDITNTFINDYSSTSTNALLYINFFGDLRKNVYDTCEIDRDTVILHLMDLLLKDVLIQIPLSEHENSNAKLQLVEKVSKKFDISLVQTDVDTFNTYGVSVYLNEEERNFIKEEAKKYKFIHKDHVDVEIPMLRCLIGKPLFVAVVQNFQQKTDSVIKLSHTLQGLKVHFVLVGKEIKPTFKSSAVFRKLANLKDVDSLLYEEVAKTFTVSLQGRETQTIKTLATDFSIDLNNFIKANDLFRSLNNDLLIGTTIDPLPDPYMERFLKRTNNIAYKDLRSICEQSEENVTIVHCSDHLKQFKSFVEKNNVGVQAIDIKNHIAPTYYQKPTLILTREKNCANKEDCYYHLKVDKNNIVKWKTEMLGLDSSRIFDRKLVIVSDNLGSGKTTIKNYLAKNCPLNYWIVDVDARIANKNLKIFSSTESLLKSYYPGDNEIDNDVMDSLMKKKKLILLLDDLNELPLNRIRSVLEKVNNFLKEGHNCWIFCTRRLNNIISEELGNAALFGIFGLNRKQQKKLIQSKIDEIDSSKEKVQNMKKIFNAKKRIFYEDVLKNPLYLLIIADRIKNEKNCELNIGQLYDIFIEKTLERNLSNSQVDDNEFFILQEMLKISQNFRLQEYEIAALKTCLEQSDFEMLNLNNQEIFLEQIKVIGDIMDIIVTKNEDGTFVFSHYSFAQYFAAKWLSKNFKNISFEQRRFIHKLEKNSKNTYVVKPEYIGIQHFLDLMLADGFPLHLAIHNRNLSQVRHLAEKHRNDVDKGGRTPLHIASSIGPKCTISEDGKIIQSLKYSLGKEKKILKYLLNIEVNHILQEDNLYHWNYFQYADASLCLSFLEELSKKKELDLKYLENYSDLSHLIEACEKFGYRNILSKAIEWQVVEHDIKTENSYFTL